jgi:predicted GNAT family acetyltransferase
VAVQRNEQLARFETVVDDQVAFLTYQERGDVQIVLVHTEVPQALEGRGIGGEIVRAALQWAREHDLVVVPRCPFVQSYLERHPEEAERTKIGELR